MFKFLRDMLKNLLLVALLGTFCVSAQVDPSILTNNPNLLLSPDLINSADVEALKGEVKEVNNSSLSSNSIKNELDTVSFIQSEVTTNKELTRLDSLKLNKYGFHVFVGINYDNIESKPYGTVSDDYIVNSGDQISVTIWGGTEYDADFKVDREGNIYPKLVGKINVKGKSVSELQEFVKQRFQNVYDLRNSQIKISVGYSSHIKVNVTGEVEKPGSYYISGVNSMFNALIQAGGPSLQANLRNIKLIRNGKVVKQFDVYQFINGLESGNIFIENGDHILVERAGNVVVCGSGFVRQGEYQIKDKETLADLLTFAGGLNVRANGSKVYISRIDQDARKTFCFNLDSLKANNIPLQKGDEVNYLTLNDKKRQYVQLNGEFILPGKYDFREGETLGDLSQRAGGFSNEFSDYIHVYSREEDLTYSVSRFFLKESAEYKNYKLKEYDVIRAFSKRDLITEKKVELIGAVKSPGEFEFRKGMTMEDLVYKLANGLNDEADLQNVIVERMNFNAENKVYVTSVKVNLKENRTFQLKPYDLVIVRSIPQFSFPQKVVITGEVNYPGNYAISTKQFKLLDLIEKAGGLTDYADLDGGVFLRKKDSLGYILMDLKDILSDPNSRFNYVLEGGDSINIHRLVNLVTLEGAIGTKWVNDRTSVNVAFHGKKRAKYYIKNFAAGFDKRAKRYSIYTVKRDGLIKRSKFFGLVRPKVLNGDRIVVLYKKEKRSKSKGIPIDWNRQIESLTVKLTGLITVYALIRNI